MSKSSSQKGNYYKLKTKKWFEAKGFEVEYLEKLQRIFAKDKVIWIKRDLFASDMLALKKPDEIIFCQVKLGKSNIAGAYKEFAKHQFPDCVKLWIVVWTPRVKEPEIVEVELEVEKEEMK